MTDGTSWTDGPGDCSVLEDAVLSHVPITAARLTADPLPDPRLAARLTARHPGLVVTGVDAAGDEKADAALLLGGNDLSGRLKRATARVSQHGPCTVYVSNPHHYRLGDAWLTGEIRADTSGGLTLEALKQAITKAGLTPLRIAIIRPDPELAKAAAEALIPFGRRHGLKAQELFDRIAPLGFVIQTRPPAMDAQPVTITAKVLGSNPDAMALVRMTQPLAALGTLPAFSVGPIGPNPPARHNADGTKRDVFIWQRPILTREHLPAIEKIRDTHKLFIVEFDDHPMRWPAIAENDYLTFGAPDAIRTSTETLATIMRQWNPNVVVSPNQIEALPPFRPVEDRSGPVRLVFAALNRKDDWSPYIKTVNAVLKCYGPDALRVDVVFDRAFFDAVEAADRHFHPMLPYAGYTALLSKADIAWLPLEDTLFNRCKSDLKFIECAAHGVAVVASPVLYGEVIDDGKTGLIYRSQAELQAALTAVIDESDLRARLVSAAYDRVATTRLRADHTSNEAQWYRDLLARRETLEEERIARMVGTPA